MFTLVEAVALLKAYGYFLVFILAFIEGPIVAVICGWLSRAGIFNLFIIYLLLIFANVLADSLLYSIGYYGGPPVIKKWGHWFGFDLEKTIKLKNHFDNYGGKLLLTVKVAPNFATMPVLVGAGLAKYSFYLFLRYTLTVEIFKTFLLLSLGYFVGSAYERIVVYFDILGFVFSFVMAIFVLGFIIYLRRKKVILP